MSYVTMNTTLETLHHHTVADYTTVSGQHCSSVNISYEIFGQALHTAPIVVVFHALTGNSDICSEEKGWWKAMFGANKCIDFNRYTVVSFNIPGNGYYSDTISNYKDFKARDVAILAYSALQSLQINKVYATIGGSLGGGIAWELAAAYPTLTEVLIPVATDWKSTDWIMGIAGTQEQILLHSPDGLATARKMAMLFYRTPESLGGKFQREFRDEETAQVNSWLNHHGKKLNQRFTTEAYLMMNQLFGSIDISYQRSLADTFKALQCKVIQIGVDSDILFTAKENIETQQLLNQYGVDNEYYEIKSVHGHDAFLIEFEQLSSILQPYFTHQINTERLS